MHYVFCKILYRFVSKAVSFQENKTFFSSGYGGSTTYGFGRQLIDKRTDWRDVILAASLSLSSGVQSMSYVIRGLEPGQNYEAKVQARNKFGWSPMSEAFTFQTTDSGQYCYHKDLFLYLVVEVFAICKWEISIFDFYVHFSLISFQPSSNREHLVT